MTTDDFRRNSDNFCYRHPDRQSFVLCQRCLRTVCPECQTPTAAGVAAEVTESRIEPADTRNPPPTITAPARNKAIAAAVSATAAHVGNDAGGSCWTTRAGIDVSLYRL